MEIKYLQVLVMPSGELLCYGESIGWLTKFGKFVFTKEEVANQKD
jgi:hypothetical protein